MGGLDAAELAAAYRYPEQLHRPFVRVNFVSSADGAATAEGRSEGLSSPGDKRVFGLLRELADVVLVGAGTARTEGYGGARCSAARRERRRGRGLADVPPVAVVTTSCALDPAGPLLTETTVPPIVLTTAAAPLERREKLLAAGADVVVLGPRRVEMGLMLDELDRRGLHRVLCEGGPQLFGELVAADAVDELCLTIAPCLTGPGASRIVTGPLTRTRALRLADALAQDGSLLLRYRRA